MAQNDSEWPISPDLQLFQSFPTEVAQNGQFRLIHNFSNLFPLKWLRMTQNDQFRPICNFSNLFPPKWLRMTQNSQFHLIRKFSNLFPPKWLRMTRNGQFCLIHNFSNLFPPKWLRMTQNGQFCPIHNFSNFSPPKWLRMTQNGQFCMAKIKYTLIQGNFYERLLFYMDSCALSPMASLLYVICVRYDIVKRGDFDVNFDANLLLYDVIHFFINWNPSIYTHNLCLLTLHLLNIITKCIFTSNLGVFGSKCSMRKEFI